MLRTTSRVIAILALAFVMLPVVPSPARATETHGDGWRSWLRGNPADVQVHTRGGAMLEGGGSDRIPAWEWFLHQAGYGDIVIVCATCGNIYNQYVLNIHAVDSVQTLKLTKPEAASDPFVIQSISGADGIFFAGGDQSDYVRVWKDSPVEDAINAVIARSGAVGGISAGLAILGQFLFAAEKDTIQSGQAMADCYAKKITLERDMLDLPVLTSAITDTHFTQRARMGRMLTFMARVITDGWASRVKGIGVDEDAAALVTTGWRGHGRRPGERLVRQDAHGRRRVVRAGSAAGDEVPRCPRDPRRLDVRHHDVERRSQPAVRVRVKDGALHWIA